MPKRIYIFSFVKTMGVSFFWLLLFSLNINDFLKIIRITITIIIITIVCVCVFVLLF